MSDIYVIIAFVVYALVMLGIGIMSYKKSKSMNDYFIGGRQLGSWTTAISAQASDMSGWLLMGLPGAIFLNGLTESWIAIGLFIGTYLNWKLLAAKLRKMSYAAGDAITIPEYFQKRFFTQNPVIRFACAAIIFVFFLVYTASAFSSGAKLFNFIFGTDYTLSLTIGAVIIISYTFLGGFFAVCWTDMIQGLLMFGALVVVPVVCIFRTPDISAVQFLNTNGEVIGNYLNMFENADGSIAWTTVLSGLAWGLGYFGMPHILVRFMAIKSSDLIKKSRIIATIWVFITLAAAVLVGIFGYIFLHSAGNEEMLDRFMHLGTGGTLDSEKIFMFLSGNLLPGLIAGIVLAAILAAIMSTADSQLLVTASSVTNDMFKLFNKKASDKTLMWISRGTVIVVAVIAYFIALDPNSSVMGLVSYAWAGLGAAFGPAMLLSLFWKRMTMSGAVAGILTGGASVVIWEMLPVVPAAEGFVTLSVGTGVYSLLPAFFLALAAVIVVSLCTRVDRAKVDELFERAKSSEKQAIGE